MKVQFLGTGAGVPSKVRNTQAIVFDFTEKIRECWLFDAGEAMQHKILDTKIKPSKINRIFISHMHADHILGLIGFLTSRSFLLNKEKKDLTIYGPKGIKDFVEFNLKMTKSMLLYNIEYVELEEKENIIYESDKVKVKSFPLMHGVVCFCYKIIFKEEKGSLLVDKLKDIGILPSPFYKEIKENDTFVFNGKEYLSKNFLEENKKGKIISIISDTLYFDELKNFVKDSNILITECTYLREEEKTLAKNHKHLCINNVYDFIKEGTFDRIYLMHISSRYEISFLRELKNNLIDKNIIITNDLDEFLM